MKPAKPKRKLPPAVAAERRIITENIRLSGYTGTITPAMLEHALKLHRENPLLARGVAYIERVVRRCTPDQVRRLLTTINEVEFLLTLTEFAVEYSWGSGERKRKIRSR
jgi:hypothetical protein